MKWVLIYIIMSQTYGSATVTQEFDDRAACQFAWDQIDRMLTSGRKTKDGDDIATISFSTCLPKGRR